MVEIPITENSERARGSAEKAAESLMRNVKGELAGEKVADCEITVSIYPAGSFNNREIVAGEFSYDSDRNVIHKPRWYMTMNHVAVKGVKASKRNEGNTWNLFPRQVANKRLDELADLNTVIPSETV